ncbi:protein of unknown function [Vibrio tapetis subsp. tapetis]|uniref:Uncharacterized protein n=1 Tax=Vibrio tapetis subsp. tapetis TaxID=1671868 RepID=A0A2N8ZI51_9VIBR|nr:protein of unknown function [Vibrio tapetis subsp. tapetis]
MLSLFCLWQESSMVYIVLIPERFLGESGLLSQTVEH